MNQLLARINENLDEVVMGARRSLVQVHSGDRGAGAGSIWHPDGLIVTNAHVVRSESMTVTLPDGTVHLARLLASDPDLDVAALTVDAEGLIAAELGESRSLRPGQWVLAIGHPWGGVRRGDLRRGHRDRVGAGSIGLFAPRGHHRGGAPQARQGDHL